MGAIGADAVGAAAKASSLEAEYGQTIDGESAYGLLNAKLAPARRAAGRR
jgi:uncharacterized protein